MRDAPPPQYHYLGKLGRAYQLAGGVRFYPVGPVEAEALAALDEVFVEGLGPSKLREVRVHAGVPVLYLARVRTRDQARAVANAGVYADPELLPEPDEDAFYVDDLLGLPVALAREDGAPEPLGEVADVLSTAGHDVLVVRGPRGEHLIPLDAPYVEIDDEGVRVVDPPEGLVDA